MEATMMQMPQYDCNEKVWALKIESADEATVYFEDKRYAPMYVGPAWVDKMNPQPGGYLVVRSSGFRSYRSGPAFEKDYTLIK
jgi:hypothetical protein